VLFVAFLEIRIASGSADYAAITAGARAAITGER
jgi:hypothetical protein